MKDEKPTRDVPRHTVTPRSGGSVTVDTNLEAEAKKPKQADPKKPKPAGEDTDA